MAIDLWIFGYGSLVWRPAFTFVECQPARIDDWTRRFWQGSVDHRGTPTTWGRVATLVPEPGASCWGMAYRVHGHSVEETLAALDYRERGGYIRVETALHLQGQGSVRGLMYLATAENPHYLGPAPLETMAQQIRLAVGESGANVEYVLRLAASLRAMGADDPHVFALASALANAGPAKTPRLP